jgi:hypothetical protein
MTRPNGSALLVEPALLLRCEAGVALIAACIAYNTVFPHQWTLFALLFLLPDVSLLAYAATQKLAAANAYNIAHTEAAPFLLGLFAFETHHHLAGKLALIWISHIEFDRLIGYGLKFSSSFRYTHIQSAKSASRS